MTSIDWVGVWVSHNRFVFKPKLFRLENLDDPGDVWYVPCGCDTHGDHLGCKRDCHDHLGCAHPLKVDVCCVKVSEQGDFEMEAVANLHIPSQDRPSKRKSNADLRQELARLKNDLDDPLGPYRQAVGESWHICRQVSNRIEEILK